MRRLRNTWNVPESLERNDKKCGNLNYQGLEWFRALCNPNGVTPCCFNNTCANKTVQECQCTEYYDFRPEVHSELADWIPDDPTCKIVQFTTKDQVCEVLRNVTLYFIGDSFLQQLCISLLGFLEDSDSANIFIDKATPADKQRCDKNDRYIGECRSYFKHNMVDCDNSTRVYCEVAYRADSVNSVLKAMRDLNRTKNSWFIFGFGVHDFFNVDRVQKNLLLPLLSKVANSDWPKLLWHEPHAAGILRTPNVPQQLNPYRIRYNTRINELMTKHNVPILRFYNMTSPVNSYNGTHYGRGVIDIKARILLDYILDQRSKL